MRAPVIGVVAVVGDHALGLRDRRVGVGEDVVERFEDGLRGAGGAGRDPHDVVVAGQRGQGPGVDEDRVDVRRREVQDEAARGAALAGDAVGEALHGAGQLALAQEEAERAELGVAAGEVGLEQPPGEGDQEVADPLVADDEPAAGGLVGDLGEERGRRKYREESEKRFS